jgi:hypothetical protein
MMLLVTVAVAVDAIVTLEGMEVINGGMYVVPLVE